MLDPKNVGDLIQQGRKNLGLTQEQLGAKLGVTGQAVSKWEQGLSLPDTALLPVICRTIGISGNAILGLDEGHGTQLDDTFSEDIREKIRNAIDEAIVESIRDKIGRRGDDSTIETMVVALSVFVGVTLVLRLITLGAPLSYFVTAVAGASAVFIAILLRRR